VLGGDLVVAASRKVLAAVKPGHTRLIVNLAEILPGDFTHNADFSLPAERIKAALGAAAGVRQAHFVDATSLATALMGNAVAANIFLVGYAYQVGALPLSAQAIETAIALNGEAVAMNQAAFRWGRRAALDPAAVEALARPIEQVSKPARDASSLDDIVSRRVAFLTAYQNTAYAARYRAWVERARKAEATLAAGKTGFAEAVARYHFKLMAYKDEYEVARLYTDGTFLAQIANEIGGENLRFEFHLAPPLLARRDANTGQPKKMAFGAWIYRLFRVLATFKFLRGTPFDPFGYSTERRVERRLIAEYEAMLSELMARLSADNHALATTLAAIPEKIRGFGHVKARHLKAAKAEEAALLEQFRASPPPLLKAAE